MYKPVLAAVAGLLVNVKPAVPQVLLAPGSFAHTHTFTTVSVPVPSTSKPNQFPEAKAKEPLCTVDPP